MAAKARLHQESHSLGGVVCGSANPFYSDELCTRKAEHIYGRGKDKMHHVRGTDRKWYSRGTQNDN